MIEKFSKYFETDRMFPEYDNDNKYTLKMFMKQELIDSVSEYFSKIFRKYNKHKNIFFSFYNESSAYGWTVRSGPYIEINNFNEDEIESYINDINSTIEETLKECLLLLEEDNNKKLHEKQVKNENEEKAKSFLNKIKS